MERYRAIAAALVLSTVTATANQPAEGVIVRFTAPRDTPVPAEF
jgi:hypothetical protein